MGDALKDAEELIENHALLEADCVLRHLRSEEHTSELQSQR